MAITRPGRGTGSTARASQYLGTEHGSHELGYRSSLLAPARRDDLQHCSRELQSRLHAGVLQRLARTWQLNAEKAQSTGVQ